MFQLIIMISHCEMLDKIVLARNESHMEEYCWKERCPLYFCVPRLSAVEAYRKGQRVHTEINYKNSNTSVKSYCSKLITSIKA